MYDAGVLENYNAQPPFIGFVSKVMKDNPGSIETWLSGFKDLGEGGLQLLYMAAWYSRTKEAEEYFEKHGIEEFSGKKGSNLLGVPVKNPTTLDLLWGMFFASGDKAPIRRIVSGFKLAEYAGSLERFKTSDKTENDKNEALLDATFRAAVWAIRSNCENHPTVLKHCRFIFENGNLDEHEKLVLGELLSNPQ